MIARAALVVALANTAASLPPAAAAALAAARGPLPAVVTVSEAGGVGFTARIQLPLPRLDAAGPCVRPRLAEPDGRGWRPVEAEPAYGWLVGVPETAGTRVEIVAVDEATWDVDADCDAVVPGGGGASVRGAPAVVASPPDRAAPVALLEPAGTLRGQALARLVVRPVALSADGRLVVRRAITVRVRFDRPGSVVRAAPMEGPFAVIAERRLLNAAWLPRRAAGSAPTVDSAGRAAAAGARAGMDGALEGRGAVGAGETQPFDAAAAADPDALKVVVDRDGPVVVTGRAAAEAGWDLGAVDPARIGLGTAAGPHALEVHDGGDGRLDPDDRLVFHGEAMTGEFARENVYWLRPRGGAAAPPEHRPSPPRDGPPPAVAFTRTVRFEADTEYLFSLHRRHGDDRWMWGGRLDAGQATTRTLEAPGALEGAPARLSLRLQGYTDDPQTAPDHHVAVALNGTPLCAEHFDGRVPHVVACAVPAGALRPGTNTLTTTLVGDTGAAVDSVYLNRIDLEHAAVYAAHGGRLDFALPSAGMWAVAPTGFDVPDIAVADVTDPARPVLLDGVAIDADGAGGFVARFADDAGPGALYRAWTPAAAGAPARIERNAPSAWRTDPIGADYVVIGPPALTAELGPLLARHRAAGMRVAVVDIADVYDEFAGGAFDPMAIRRLLQHARAAWPAPAPTYALLVGESNLDYRGGMGVGPPNVVPAVRVEVDTGGSGATTSDVWYGALDGEDDVLPDVLIGRLSVTTPDQVAGYVRKLEGFLSLAPDAPARHRAIMVADDDGAPAFEAFNRYVAARMPEGHEATWFDAASYPRGADLTADIAAAVEGGALVLNFTGHGNVDLWSPWPGGGRIFETGDIAALTGGSTTPLFTTATCMNGMIDHPLKATSMAELWVRHPEGGGVAAWSPSGFTAVFGQRTLFGTFYDGLYDGQGRSVGAVALDAMTAAFAESASVRDVVRMFVLVGDPATVISGVPILPTATATATAPATSTVTAAPTRTPPVRAVHLPALHRDH